MRTHGNIPGLWIWHRVPFFVRRDTWSRFSLFCVVDVVPKASRSGLYGKAWGYFVHADTGDFEDFQELGCAGCYQWALVPVPGDGGMQSNPFS